MTPIEEKCQLTTINEESILYGKIIKNLLLPWLLPYYINGLKND